MKKIIAAVLMLSLVSVPAFARGGGGSHGGRVSVRGYTTTSGKYVSPHRRTAPNHTKGDNWSTRGNVNPDTGKAGTK